MTSFCYTELMSGKLNSAFLLILPILLSIGVSYYLQYTVLKNQLDFTSWLASFGPYVIVVYIILQAIMTIIAPLGGFFLVVGMIALFGPGFALTLFYLVTTPCYLINFLIARNYGRPLIKKLLGEETLEKIDHFVQNEGLMALILTKLFQGGYFDYLSYAWGLTKIPFKTFAIANIIFGIPATAIIYFVFREFNSLTYGLIAFYVVTTVLTGVSIVLSRTLMPPKR